ncbi:hypothetical protein HYX07_04915 [Candidatus Woesearchaeota archaeon]|nr:hypothetical protein [Candidatus Woesearchaeota archaeon]
MADSGKILPAKLAVALVTPASLAVLPSSAQALDANVLAQRIAKEIMRTSAFVYHASSIPRADLSASQMERFIEQVEKLTGGRVRGEFAQKDGDIWVYLFKPNPDYYPY